MSKKIKLTERQHKLIVSKLIEERLGKNETLDEGFWDTIKYGLSKLGRYKAGGKILGKSSIDQDAARRIQQIIDKEGNELIRQLDAKIREQNPKFPNNKEPQQFLTTVTEIAAVYDSIVGATNINPNEKGYMPIDAANGIINDLREYVKKFLDVDLTAVYSGFNEGKELNEYGEDSGGQDMTWGRYKHDTSISSSIDQRMMAPFNIAVDIEEALPKSYIENDVESAIEKYIDFNQINREVADKYMSKEDWWDDLYYNINDIRRKREEERGELNEDDPLDASDVRANLQSKRGEEDGEDFSSSRMDTLKSNKLPLILAGVGASLGALGWMAQTDWFKTWIESLLGADKTITNTKDIVNNISGGQPDSKGFVSWASKIMGKNLTTASDIQEFINKFGAENVSHMFDGNGAGDSMNQVTKLQELINSNPNASVGEMFNKADQTFGDMKGGRNLFGVSKAASFFATTVTKQITKTLVKGGGTALAGTLAGLGPIVAGVGIGLITTGALVKLIRMKGQKSSRAATLNALYQSMRNIKGGVGIVEPAGDEIATQDGGAGGTGGNTGGGQINKNICNTQNLEELNKILKQVKDLSQPLKQINDYKKLTGFNTIFLDSFINTTKSVKINGKPLLKTLQDLNSQGLLEEPDYGRKTYSMSGSQRKSLKFKLDLQNFMASVMKLFSSTYKGCKKTSKTYQVIKNFFKQLFIIASQGKSNITDEQTRNILFNKLIGNFEQFLSQLNKLPDMERGTVEKTVGTPKKTKNTNDGVFAGSAPRTKPQFQGQSKNQQAPAASPRPSASQSSPTGQNVVPENLDHKLMEEIQRIKKIMLNS